MAAFCANEGVLVPLPRKLRANVFKHGFFCFISNCIADTAGAVLPCVRADEADRAVLDCVGWLLYDCKNVDISFVPEWQNERFK